MKNLLLPLFIVALATTSLSAQEDCCKEAIAKGDAACCGEAAPLVEEPSTDEMFPAWLDLSLGSGDDMSVVRHHSVALGVRKKYGLFKVYGFSMYFDLAGLASDQALAKAAGDSSIDDLEDDEAFHQALMGDKFGISLQWTMVRDVEAEDIAEAFDDVLKPRMASKAKGEKEVAAAKKALADFAKYFSVGELTEGTMVRFYWEPGGHLHTWVAGEKKEVITNLYLCWALFDVYLGDADDLVSEDVRDDAVAAAYGALHPQTASVEE